MIPITNKLISNAAKPRLFPEAEQAQWSGVPCGLIDEDDNADWGGGGGDYASKNLA